VIKNVPPWTVLIKRKIVFANGVPRETTNSVPRETIMRA